LILFPPTVWVRPCIFSGLLPVRFMRPWLLHDDTHDAGRLALGRLQTPLGAGPMFSCGRHISRIFMTVFTLPRGVDHCSQVVMPPIKTALSPRDAGAFSWHARNFLGRL